MAGKRGSTEWTPLYLVIVIIIAAILIITFIKPMFRASAVQAGETMDAAKQVAGAGLFLLSTRLKQKGVGR